MARSAAGAGRAALRNLALAAGSILAAFGGAEVLLRLTGCAPAHALRSADLRTLERIPGLYDPGQEFTDAVRPDLPARIRVNNLGFRGRDAAERKAPGTFRILALGDSYTFGDHVDDGEAWPALLEEEIRRRRPTLAVEVVNAGVNGFGIQDEIAYLRRVGGRLDPDVVLVAFSPNDVSDTTRPSPVIDQMLAHAALKSRPVVGTAIGLLQETAVFNGLQIVAARIRVATRSHAAIPEVEPARAGPEAAPAAWEAYRRGLHEIAADLRREGRRSLLILYPSHGNLDGSDRPHGSEILPAWASEAGLPCLDLLPAFREAAGRGGTLYLVPRDSHPSPAGHRIAAAAIAGEVERLGWLPETPPGAAPR